VVGELTRQRVFISWSGSTSKRVALVFRKYIAEAFDSVEPFVSDRDVGAGARSMEVIHEELKDSAAGLIIVTLDNQERPWLNYEAGALGREVRDAKHRVIPVLVDSERLGDLQPPLGLFQGVKVDQEGMLKIFEALCDVVGLPRPRAEAKLETYYERLKADVNEAKVYAVRQVGTRPRTPRPTLEDKVDQVLVTVRNLAGQAGEAVPGQGHSPDFVAQLLARWAKKSGISAVFSTQGDNLLIQNSRYTDRDRILNAVVVAISRGNIQAVRFIDEDPPF
jgi:hypothetical protein